MKSSDFYELGADHFSNNDYFIHLKNGTEFFQKRNYSRSIEEFTAAGLIEFVNHIGLQSGPQGIAFKGDIAKTPLLFLLYAVFENKVSGVGVLKADEGKDKKIILKNGNIIRVTSAEKENRIGHFLVAGNHLSELELSIFESEAKKQKIRIGSLLVKKNLISKKSLHELLAQQTQENFSRALSCKSGTFFFKQTEIKEKPLVTFPPLKMAWYAAHRCFNFNDFRKEIPDNKIIFKPTRYAEQEKDNILSTLDANDQFIFFLVDGTRNIEQLMKFSGSDEISVINILFKLSSMGLIRKTRDVREYEDQEFEEVQMTIGVLFDIYSLVYDELTEELGKYGVEMIKNMKKEVKEEHAAVFEGISFDKPETMEEKTILKNIANHFPHKEKRFIFVDAFLELFRKSLEELNRYLGIGLRKKTIKRMETIMENLERFSINSQLKSYMMDNLAKLIK